MLEFLPSQQEILYWLPQMGSIALFFLLALGIIALPIPDETLLILSGILMGKQVLAVIPTLIAAYAGSLCGITGSYFIGKCINNIFLEKYGQKIGLTHRRLKVAHEWFEKFGKWTLFFGYFVPGIRHLTGITAGITQLEFRSFALFAYTGGILWVTLFLILGYFLGEYGLVIVEKLDQYLDPILIVIAVLLIVVGYVIVKKKFFKK